MRWKLSSLFNFASRIRTKANVTLFQQPINLPPEKGLYSEKGHRTQRNDIFGSSRQLVLLQS